MLNSFFFCILKLVSFFLPFSTLGDCRITRHKGASGSKELAKLENDNDRSAKSVMQGQNILL